MAYQKGAKILAADYNALLNTVGNIYGQGYGDRGYGQSAIVQAPITVGTKMAATPMVNLVNMIKVCAAHQGTAIPALPPTTEFVTGQLAKAEETSAPTNAPYDINDYAAAIDSNRFNPTGDTFSYVTNTFGMVKPGAWGDIAVPTITGQMAAFWNNENQARYFFNSGAFLELDFVHPVLITKDTYLENVLAYHVGAVRMYSASTTNTGSDAHSGPYNVTANIGYYQLTDAYQLIYNGANLLGGGYNSFNVYIWAKRSGFAGVLGGNGNGIVFQIQITINGSVTSAPQLSAGTRAQFAYYYPTVKLAGISGPVSYSVPLNW